MKDKMKLKMKEDMRINESYKRERRVYFFAKVQLHSHKAGLKSTEKIPRKRYKFNSATLI